MATLIFTGRQKGGFVSGWFWRMCPRSGFRSGGRFESALVPVFVPGEHPNVPSSWFSFRESIRQNRPFGKPPFCQPPKFLVPSMALVAPYRAILRYYCCDTPCRAILFQGGEHSPKMVRYPRLVLSFTQAHLCEYPILQRIAR